MRVAILYDAGSEDWSPQDVAATVFHHLGIDSRSVTFEDKTGRPTYLIERGEPIKELVG